MLCKSQASVLNVEETRGPRSALLHGSTCIIEGDYGGWWEDGPLGGDGGLAPRPWDAQTERDTQRLRVLRGFVCLCDMVCSSVAISRPFGPVFWPRVGPPYVPVLI